MKRRGRLEGRPRIGAFEGGLELPAEVGRLGDRTHLVDQCGRRVGAIHHVEDRDGTVHVQDPELIDLARPWWVRDGFAPEWP